LLYLIVIRTHAEALDVPTPVVDALIDLLTAIDEGGSDCCLLALNAVQRPSDGTQGAKAAALLHLC
jgi:hypothetical protein